MNAHADERVRTTNPFDTLSPWRLARGTTWGRAPQHTPPHQTPAMGDGSHLGPVGRAELGQRPLMPLTVGLPGPLTERPPAGDP
jgi:hypothetical protein